MNANLNSGRLRRVGTRFVMGAGLLASLAGIYAFRALSSRPGEAALRFVPADAMMVASIDLSPSASQTMAFKRIDEAIARNGFDGLVEKSLIDLFDSGNPGVEPLRPLTLRNGAVALLPGPDGTMKDAKGLAFIAVNSGAAAQAALEKYGVPQYFRGTKSYKLKRGRSFYMVEGDLLIVGENTTALHRARQVIKGEAPSITANAQFNGARSHVSDDANVKFFLSPRIVAESGIKDMDGMMADWMSVGLAIRDGGIGLSYAGMMDVTKMPEIARMTQIPPIRSDLFRILPEGAYGATILSQPSAYFESMEGTMKKDKDLQKTFTEMEESVQKETGMDFRKDILPAFKGHFITAAYPAATGSPSGVDMLLVLDDANGADPAHAVEQFRNWVAKQMEKEGNQQGALWTERQANGAQFFRINDKLQDDLRKSMNEGVGEADLNKDALVNKKTVTWAVVGRAVIAATNEDLLARAVQSYQGSGSGLSADPKFKPVEQELLDGSQQVTMFSLSRIAEGVRNTVNTAKMDSDGKKLFENVLNAFASLDQPLTMKGRARPDGRVSGGMFIPLDYDKVLDMAGSVGEKKK